MPPAATSPRFTRRLSFCLIALGWLQTARADEPLQLERVQVSGQGLNLARQNVPGTVTAYDGAFLAAQGIANFQDLAPTVPGFFVVAQSVEMVSLNLRGLTSDTNDPRVQPQVSVFQDGVLFGNSHGNSVALFDLQEVAVSKGPQPTQFGRGVQAGALSLTSRRAVDERITSLSLGAGSRDGASFGAIVNRPIIAGKLFARVAVSAVRREGYVTNAVNGSDLQGEGTFAGRASVRWQPSAETTADVIFSFQRDATPGLAVKSMLGIPGLPAVADTNPFTATRLTRGSDLHVNRTIAGLTAIVNHRINDAWTLTSATAGRDVRSENEFDADGSIYYLIEAGETFHGQQFSQELRFDYDRSGPLTATIGLSALESTDEQKVVIRTDENLMWQFFTRVPPPIPFNSRYAERNATGGATRAGDVFGRADYRLFERFTVGAGLRLTQERLRSRFQSFAAVPRGNIVGILPTSGGPNDLFKETPGRLEHSRDVGSWTGQLDVRREFTPQFTAYASVSRGRRPPVLDTDEITLAARTHAEEIVWNYEAGFKAATADRKVRLEASVFDYRYEHFQSRRIVPPGVIQAYDGGRARGRGFEVTTQADAARGVELFAAYGYTDAAFAATDENGAAQLFAGNTFRLTSRHVATLGATISYAIAGRGTFFISPRYSYRSAHYFEDNNAQSGGILRQGGYGLANVRLGYRTPGGRWEFAAQAANLFDKQYLLDAGNIGGAYGIPTLAPAAPRTVDVQATVRF